ncbi:MAG: sporulation protein YunB [Bacillota bacterium]|nr:sporulation protein YunB [Bacillota bacterium]
MFRRRNRFTLKFRALFLFIIVGFFLVGGLLILEFTFKPTITEVASVKAKLLATEAIHKAIYENVVADVNYQDLIIVEKNNNNDITMMQANTLGIRKIQSETILKIQSVLEELSTEGFKIPTGQILGSRLLAAYGPKVNVNLIPVGTVKVDIINDFHEAGINQVRHLIYLDIETTVKIVVPLFDSEEIVSTKIPVAETIIVGPVPDTLVRLDLGSGLNPQGLNDLFQSQ